MPEGDLWEAVLIAPPPKPFVIVTVTGLDVGTDVELTDSTTGGSMGTATEAAAARVQAASTNAKTQTAVAHRRALVRDCVNAKSVWAHCPPGSLRARK